MISVCLVSYNGEEYIKEQIDSILKQIKSSDELIISDDGSTDSTLAIIRSYNDNRIKLYHHQKGNQKYLFGYTSENVRHALMLAKGDYIFLADQDDVWLDNKVSLMLSYLIEYDLVLADCLDVDSNLKILNSSHFHLVGTKKSFFKNIMKSGYLGANMCFTRTFMERFLPIPQNVPHDLWIGSICSLVGRMYLLSEKTMLYRRHDKNVSSTNNKLLNKQKEGAIKLDKNRNTLFFKIEYRLIIAREIVKFLYRQRI